MGWTGWKRKYDARPGTEYVAQLCRVIFILFHSKTTPQFAHGLETFHLACRFHHLLFHVYYLPRLRFIKPTALLIKFYQV